MAFPNCINDGREPTRVPALETDWGSPCPAAQLERRSCYIAAQQVGLKLVGKAEALLLITVTQNVLLEELRVLYELNQWSLQVPNIRRACAMDR
jgi:hypothetical protein